MPDDDDEDDEEVPLCMLGAGEDTSDKAKEVVELRDPAPERSSPPIDDEVPWPELLIDETPTPESLSSMATEGG